jgi:spore coat polysaccharide biosynthesis predicted glycosyltransferase SpsG/CMP-N-acetylneuraminic acid synthetase
VKDGRRVLCVVPARGGTDTVPYLNVKRLGDRPLIAHTLEAARQAQCVDRVVVSTDDPQVAEIARAWGAEAPFLRPPELARNLPSLKPVIAHAVREMETRGERADLVVVLQATTPFREAAAIDLAVDTLLGGGFDSVISVTEDRTLNWRVQDGRLVPLFEKESRREDQPPLYKENGAVVALRRAVLDSPSRFGERVGHLVLDKRSAFTVYDLQDFWMAERLLREPRVLFRVDGGRDLGMGHVTRSLAIAGALRERARAEIAFLMSADHHEGVREAGRAGFAVRALGDGRVETCLDHIRDFAPAIVINDLPRLESSYLRALAHLGATTVNLVDTPEDLEAAEQYEQLIISVMGQDKETPEGFYAGPAYAILREQFRGRAKQVREEPRLVLLSFGGSDPQGLTLKAARALSGLPERIEVLAVTGPAFAHGGELRALLPTLGRPFRLIEQAGGHIAELMLEADLMVGSGGMSVYEIAALGTPGVVLAQNAREEARMQAFARHGTIRYLGLGVEVAEEDLRAAVEGLLGDAEARREMSARGRALVDGRGAARTAGLVLERHERQKETTEAPR